MSTQRPWYPGHHARIDNGSVTVRNTRMGSGAEAFGGPLIVPVDGGDRPAASMITMTRHGHMDQRHHKRRMW